MVRHGENQCEISARFDVSQLTAVEDWLEQRDFLNETQVEDQQNCLIRRIIRTDKPTKCYINDQPTTLGSLRELGLLLVDLHGQHEHQSLLRRPTQRQIIDQFANHPKELKQLAILAAQIHRLEKSLAEISSDNSDNADRMELLAFQLNELDEAALHPGEYQQLVADQARLSNAQELIDGIELAKDRLFHNEESNISSQLGVEIKRLEQLSEFDSELAKVTELLNSALSNLDETQSSLETSLARIEQNPERLSETDQRLATIVNLARKHRCSEEHLIEKQHALRSEYEQLAGNQSEPAQLQLKLSKLVSEYTELATKISTQRQQAAANLSEQITAQMQDLGMAGGYLDIQVEPQYADKQIISESGIDQIEYMVSTNYGMPAKPLVSTASGGELSRISLAIQVIASAQSNTPSLVFDEVDVGVGGKVAGIVGERLHNLGNNAQVICITHLAQVAAYGDHHFAVDKVSSSYETYSTLIELDHDMRIEEIARMLGGKEITDRSRAHAREMLERSDFDPASSQLAG